MSDSESERDGAREPAAGEAGSPLPIGGALGRTVRAGLSGEDVSARGVLAAIGGWRGVAESLLPGLLFLVVYVFTQDPSVSVIAPAVLAVLAVVLRLALRQPAASAFSGALGVAVCVAATLLTGSGRDYFLPGFWINGAWSAALLISLLAGWPLLGVALGALRGDLRAWRGDRVLRRVATWTTLLWLGMFAARLAVQLPLYLADRTEALGLARLVMGVPLFALVVLFTWLLLSRFATSSDESDSELKRNA
ncbi:DUF3159 domain-containing protein [Leucobacter chromiisoli]|uniref:DUF3159 domain-containing protein n=1 Tax=Leucobacter chromiisoli TaxID=2796471 RepID=UPI0027DC9856|nr:DUF3159 domain-containing protein [Leucobacter chromiisoli]